MAKLPAQQLFQLVREVVQDEIKKTLPSLVRECLTEQYIKKIMHEQVTAPQKRRGGLAERLMDEPTTEEQETPEPLEPAGDGIYQQSALVKPEQQVNEVVSRLVGKDRVLAEIFEGTKPLQAQETAAAPGEVPPKLLESMVNKDLMKKLAFGGKSKQAPGASQSATSWEEERLKRQREALERPVNGGAARSSPRPMPRFADDADDSAGFPDRPIPGA